MATTKLWKDNGYEYEANCKHCGGRIYRLIEPDPELFQDDKWRHALDSDAYNCAMLGVERKEVLITEPA